MMIPHGAAVAIRCLLAVVLAASLLSHALASTVVAPSSTPWAAKFALDLRYARSLQGVKIAEASAEQMQKLDLGSPAQRAAWQTKMASIFPDVADGTHLTGVYLPQQGARFYLDVKMLGEIQDVEFAYAFFAIWLGTKTTAPALRAALLTDAAPR